MQSSAHFSDLLKSGKIDVRIEVPKGAFVKKNHNNEKDFYSPIPCPYNYGSVLGTKGEDQEPLDAFILGPRIQENTITKTKPQGVILFLDSGVTDPKLICADHKLSVQEQKKVVRFMRFYVQLKKISHLLKRKPGKTEVMGFLTIEQFQNIRNLDELYKITKLPLLT